MHRGPRRSPKARVNAKITGYVRVSAEQFRDARVFAGLTREDAAELLGVSLRTVGHWETGRARPSYAAFRLLRVYRHGDLIDPAWAGYRIIRGRLVTPEGRSFLPGDMAWLGLLVRRAAAFSDLLKQRDAGAFLPVAGQPRGSARPVASEASDSPALGLSLYSTKDKESRSSRDFSGSLSSVPDGGRVSRRGLRRTRRAGGRVIPPPASSAGQPVTPSSPGAPLSPRDVAGGVP